jgi:DoxX-like family
MDANLVLWVGQILLALAFLQVGYGHSLGFDSWSARQGMGWLSAVGRDRMRIIALLETLGAIGLVLVAFGRFVVAPL